MLIQRPAGAAGQVRPRGVCDEEAHRPPRGKRSAWNGNQQTPLTGQLKNCRQARFSSSLSTV
ncbi:hypothetical protein CVD28_17235 [Bacillus sp. M6-12]|nr:hypothetical protein CVD28_17235 [Bacillus sp. M6-12]